jgi:hypothetical protein
MVDMRLALDCVVVGGLLVSACSFAAPGAESRGDTLRKYRGSVAVVFTNATPDRMCGLFMSDDGEDAYGDNWLPAGGLAPGKSLDLQIRTGTYKARWDTCRPDDKAKPFYAATLFRETSFQIKEPTQLFAYVATAMAPTKMAPPRWDLKMVHFQGQPISQDFLRASASTRHLAHAPRKAPEPPAVPRYLCRFCVSGAPSGIEAQFTEPLVEVERVDMSAYVDPRLKRPAAKPVVRPSLRRNHDVAQARVNYRLR